jgi:hypothetical protein
MRNSVGKPVLVNHNCPEHGPRLVAAASMSVQSRCGRQCEVDLDDWVATQRDHYPDEDLDELARQAGFPAQARGSLAEF